MPMKINTNPCPICHGLGYIYVSPEGTALPLWECPTDYAGDTSPCFICDGKGETVSFVEHVEEERI